jgi:Xaa-Pro aminopeptidase
MTDVHTIRRKSLTTTLNGALVVMTAYDRLQQSADMEAPFLQEASFWWLTGIEEPGWKVIIDGLRNWTTLVRPAMSDVHRIFNGGMSDEDAMRASSANEIISSDQLEAQLRQLHRKHSVVHTAYSRNQTYEFTLNPAPRELYDMLGRIFTTTQDCSAQLHALRALKQPDELTEMERAIKLTASAFKDIRAQLATYKAEYEIEADFTQYFRRHNANHAYAPIVAAGKNACTLHYGQNAMKIPSRSLILIDIGARINGYCADITRTYAINPTKRQREVHAAVERAHKAIIALIKPNLPVAEYIAQVDGIMKSTLVDLKLLQDKTDEAMYRRYFPHAVSHGLGVDVHDSLGAPRYFQAGMVITVEPGVYIPEEGIGVRIEDDILITPQGHRNLSGGLSTSL